MNFNKTRCSVCCRHFCCTAHRDDHEQKNHAEQIRKQNQDFLLKMFQKKAKDVLTKSQNRHDIHKVKNKKEKSQLDLNLVGHKSPVKRTYSKKNMQFSTITATVSTQTRTILVPVHRLPTGKSSDKENCKSIDFVKPKIDSPCDVGIVKTSTPIINDISSRSDSHSRWNISSTSSISNYHTFYDVFTEEQAFKSQSSKGPATATPLRSIISKTSKYESDHEVNPSPIFNTSRSRRVTFSFSQTSSATSSPLEPVQEVEIHEELQDERIYVVKLKNKEDECCAEAEDQSRQFQQLKKLIEDSPSIKNGGFFSCMTNIFCSAVNTIPTLSLWRVHTGASKRSRSSDEDAEGAVVGSPLHKRPCYPYDLRQNPIKARPPISHF